jgi:hypothetical protein
MRMQEKSFVLGCLFVVGGIGLVVLAEDFGSQHVATVIAMIWLLIFAIGQFSWLKCPHCGKFAGITRGGLSSPWVGSSCRYCGKEY